MVYPIFKRTILPIFKVFLKEVKGIENIPLKGPFIVAANHDSYLDPLLIAYYVINKTNQKIHFIAYKGRFAFLGNFLIKKWAGCILIRYNKKEIDAALKEAVSILKNSGIVGIFPAAPHHELTNPKTGVARIALAAGCPVLPVAISGTEEIMPAPSLMPRRFKYASLHFGKPILFKKIQKNIRETAKKIAKVILRGLNKK